MQVEQTFEEALERAESAAARTGEWRSHLLKLASGSVPEIEEVSFLGRELRAAATVAAMAELEALLREMLVSIGREVNVSQASIRELRPSLRPLATHSLFESLADSRNSETAWSHKRTVTNLDQSYELAQLPSRMRKSPQPPLDGRTIQSRHLALVWNVLGLEQPIPSASVVASLKKLTQIRNDVAHRNVDIAQVFSEAGRSARDIAGYLDDVVLLCLHIGSEWSEYVANRAFLATNAPKGSEL